MISTSLFESIVHAQFEPQIQKHQDISHFYYDTRLINNVDNAVFLALPGQFRDGHQFIEEAYKLGIRYFLISQDISNYKHLKDAFFLKVDNTLTAFQEIVSQYRNQFAIPVIGITGSNGKTIVKEWLFQLLYDEFKIIRNPKSYNSQLGVPLSILLMKDEHEIGIFEAGISQKNEMQPLASIIQPTIGILTNLGDAHQNFFKSPEEKLKEKLLLFKNVATLIYSKDQLPVNQTILRLKSEGFFENPELQLFTWGKSNENTLQVKRTYSSTQKTLIEAEYQEKTYRIQIPFSDEASIENAIHCWACLLHLGKDEDSIRAYFKKLYPVKMRLERLAGVNDTIIINDSYNSDLTSIKIALNYLNKQHQFPKKTVILSDIHQLSIQSQEVYPMIATWIAEREIQRFIGIGPQLIKFKELFEQIPNLETSFYKNTHTFLEEIDQYTFRDEYILLKGSRIYSLEKIKKRLELKLHRTYLEVHLEGIKHNFLTYKSFIKPATKVMGVVKAHGYGGGSLDMAQVLQEAGADYLAVAYIDEGITLKIAGVDLPIMVMNPDLHSIDRMIAWNLEPEIYNLKLLKAFTNQLKAQSIESYPIHIKIDTGMHRLGFSAEDLPALYKFLSQHKRFLKVQSIFSHLVASESLEFDAYTQKQYDNFLTAYEYLKPVLPTDVIKHILNSSGILRHPSYQLDMVRLGIGLYGVDPSETVSARLETPLFLKTTIAQIKKIKKDEGVGYSLAGSVKRDSVIATVNIGYADGYLRKLGLGNAKMFVGGQSAPVVGNICMDMCMIDITGIEGIEGIEEGDEVEVFGNNIKLTELSKWAKTIPYEILTNISQRVPRIYVQNQ